MSYACTTLSAASTARLELSDYHVSLLALALQVTIRTLNYFDIVLEILEYGANGAVV
jgi:hypothetical protein